MREEQYEKIEAYLEGTLNEEEKLAFEKEMSEDQALKNAVALEKDLQTFLPDTAELAFRQNLEQVNKNWKNKQGGSTISMRWFSIAAGMLLVFGFSFWKTIFSPAPLNNQELFAAHFEPYQMVLNTRSGGQLEGENQLKLNEALEAYADKNYSKAAIAFQNLAEIEPDNELYELYSGLSHLAAGHADTSIEILEVLQRKSSPSLREQIQWYLGLAYLKNDQKEEAKRTLSSIDEGEYRYEEAKKVLEDMR
ncbi:MAG: hypothetical protein KDC24_06495 [Saprospiraceae bacterium]|nr:hypothetical protein [Saprospiraceae bacterium]